MPKYGRTSKLYVQGTSFFLNPQLQGFKEKRDISLTEGEPHFTKTCDAQEFLIPLILNWDLDSRFHMLSGSTLTSA